MNWGHCTFYFKAQKSENVIGYDNISQKVKNYNVKTIEALTSFFTNSKMYKLRNA